MSGTRAKTATSTKDMRFGPHTAGHGDAREDVADRLDPTATDFVRASVAHVLDPLPSRARSAGDGVGVPGRIVPARLCKQVAP